MSLTVTHGQGVTIFACKRDGGDVRKCQYQLRGVKKGKLCGRRADMRINRKGYCRAHGQMIERDRPSLIQADRGA